MIKPEVGRRYRIGPFWPFEKLDPEEWAEAICTWIIDDTYSDFEIINEAPCRVGGRMDHQGKHTHNSNVQEL